MAAERARGLRLAAELADTESGEVYRLVEERKARSPYQFGPKGFGQVSIDQLELLTAEASGIPGDHLKVLMCCVHQSVTEPRGGATAAQIAKHTGFTPQAVRRIVKVLTQHRIFLVAEVVGRTTVYRPSPHVFHRGAGVDHGEAVQAVHLPTMPGPKKRPTPKEKPDGKQPLSRTGGGHGPDGGAPPAAPEAELDRALRRQGWPRR